MKNSENKLSSLMQGAMLLSIASLISKVLSAFYRVPFQNLVGNVGFYIYQQVYPIYGIGMTLALTGLPIFISRVIAEQDSQMNKKALLRQILITLSCFGFIIFIALQISAFQIARLMGDPNLVGIIQAVSWMFLFMPFLASFRGYFQAILFMKPTAYSQVIEQLMRVSVILLAAYIGFINHLSPYTVGKYAMLAVPIAEAFSLAVLLIYYRKNIGKLPNIKQMAYPNLTKQLLLEGGTLCLLASIMVLLQLVDSFTVRKGLVLSGLSVIDSQVSKGIYDRGQTLVQLGLVFATSFSTAILPSLSQAYKKKAYDSFNGIANEMMRVSIFLTVAITAGMISLMPMINQLLFNSQTESHTLSVYCFSILITTIITIYSSILQSVDQFKIAAFSIMAGLLLKLIITEFLTAKIGIIGASISTIISLFFVLILELYFSKFKLKMNNKLSFTIKLMLNAMIMVIMEFWLSNIVIKHIPFNNFRLKALIVLLILIPIGALSFIFVAKKINILSDEEWKSVPIINKFINR
ncbi:putative polysaccharide biosynthesis protein [Apilactobacillus timberlakei]|uniref:putative polysaccharide biosynthesis protein n=1 Tax=Apilactobacillus timberlakei TaxID=2008380 RepID=UPI001128D5C4|nr:polysaccharide biosynthesis protein [Apilactobacillus timberlakei]TPR16332.1 polysaccharide biosynthesis protein [Apilactobacillus timberlakei]